MTLSEEELDSWFIELPLSVKKDFYHLWFFPIEEFSPDEDIKKYLDWDDIFKCESNTPVE